MSEAMSAGRFLPRAYRERLCVWRSQVQATTAKLNGLGFGLCLVGSGGPWEVRSFEEQCEIGALESIPWLWVVIGLEGTGR